MAEAQKEDAAKLEARALRLSLVGYAAMAALGIGFALATRSEAVMLDGVYSGVSFVMTLLAARVARLAEVPRGKWFHFGYAHLEPLLNMIRGLMILAMAGIAFFSAINSLLHQGRPIQAGWAVLYALAAAAGCLFLARLQRKNAQKTGSPTLEMDAGNWRVDGLISLGAGLAFLIGAVLQATAWVCYADYVDPLLVIIMVLVMAKQPFTVLYGNLVQVLQMAPEEDMQLKVEQAVDKGLAGLDHAQRKISMQPVGRYFYLLVHVLVADGQPLLPTARLDRVREAVTREVAGLHPRPVVEVLFTADRRWLWEDNPFTAVSDS